MHVAINEQDAEIHLVVYPNPISGNILNIDTEEKGSFLIVDIMGKVLLNGAIFKGQNQIAVDNLNAGIYFVKVNNKTIKINKL